MSTPMERLDRESRILIRQLAGIARERGNGLQSDDDVVACENALAQHILSVKQTDGKAAALDSLMSLTNS